MWKLNSLQIDLRERNSDRDRCSRAVMKFRDKQIVSNQETLLHGGRWDAKEIKQESADDEHDDESEYDCIRPFPKLAFRPFSVGLSVALRGVHSREPLIVRRLSSFISNVRSGQQFVYDLGQLMINSARDRGWDALASDQAS